MAQTEGKAASLLYEFDLSLSLWDQIDSSRPFRFPSSGEDRRWQLLRQLSQSYINVPAVEKSGVLQLSQMVGRNLLVGIDNLH